MEALYVWLAATCGWLAYQLPELGKGFKKNDFSWNYWVKNNLIQVIGSFFAVAALIFTQPAIELMLAKMTGIEWFTEVGLAISAFIGYGGTRLIKVIYRWLFKKVEEAK